MSWHYRVLRHPDGSLALHEVFCDKAGKPQSYTDKPIGFGADEEEGLAGIIGGLEMALKDARERPILNMDQFAPPPHFEKPAHISQEDWDSVDVPELTDEEMARAVPFSQAFPEAYASWKIRAEGQRSANSPRCITEETDTGPPHE
jgi:hypothetical protein